VKLQNCIEQLVSLLQQLSTVVVVLSDGLEELAEISAFDRFNRNLPPHFPKENELC
jgi:hypothetical protein